MPGATHLGETMQINTARGHNVLVRRHWRIYGARDTQKMREDNIVSLSLNSGPSVTSRVHAA